MFRVITLILQYGQTIIYLFIGIYIVSNIHSFKQDCEWTAFLLNFCTQ